MFSTLKEATCLAGVVRVDGEIVPGVQVMTQGVAQSSGLIIMDGDMFKYLTSTAQDLKEVMTQLDSIIQQVVLITTALDAVSTTPGSATALITALTTLKTTLATKRENLR